MTQDKQLKIERQLLNGPERHATHHEMRGEGVPHLAASVLRDAVEVLELGRGACGFDGDGRGWK